MRTYLFTPVFAVLAITSFARGEDDAPPPRWNTTVECEMVILRQKDALALLPDLLDEKKAEGAYARIQKLIGSGDAELAANLIAKVRDREKGSSETVEELRYGTEYNPPYLPQNAPENVRMPGPLVGGSG